MADGWPGLFWLDGLPAWGAAKVTKQCSEYTIELELSREWIGENMIFAEMQIARFCSTKRRQAAKFCGENFCG